MQFQIAFSTELNMKSIALSLLVIGCLLAVVFAVPGKVIINGECTDCIGPDGRPIGQTPPVEPASAAVTQTLTSGAVIFGLLYYSMGFLLRNVAH
ncbi:uncharacterized protein LOC117784916 [Drosophila innubila]|uniref:uncharacterized protein LOC117784916 n=1 Tax=Drosophila innubila TaxID=198719 RepID=UPI00148B610D|nr:uncharacterized protein LOC117784916 [Drosophila innubila]